MRIIRFDLERYGHVSGEYMEFPTDIGLHVVVGANEAGKSTALKGLADALFGFGRGRDNHPDDPRLGFTLRAQDGTEASFVRRKAGRDKLLDAAGSPVPEAALQRFLGGTGRERFLDVYGLDAERLRSAGRAIMAEEGEAGATILQAHTGLRGLRETVDHLDGEAKLLFGDGRGARRISVAAGTIKDNRRLVADRSLSGPDYLAQIEREAELGRQLDALTEERQALRREQAGLDRIRRTAPFRTELVELAVRYAVLGPAVPLPVDAASRFAEAAERQARSIDAARREQAELDALDAAEASLVQDPAVLAVADALRLLEADRTHIAEIRRDLLTVSGQATASLRTVEAVARDLDIAERGADLRARLPDLSTRRAAERLLNDHQKRTGARTIATEAVRSAEQARDAEAAALEALPHVPALEALRDAVEAARNAGSIDDEVQAGADRLAAAAAERDRRLARLAGWDGDADALERSRMPLESDAARLGAGLEAAERASRDADAARMRHEAAIEAARVTVAGIEAAGALPTRESLLAVRQRRDEGWRALRRALDAGLPPGSLPDDVERLVLEADAVADARLSELARLRDWEQGRQHAAELMAAYPGLVAAAELARAAPRDCRCRRLACRLAGGCDAVRPARHARMGARPARYPRFDRGRPGRRAGARHRLAPSRQFARGPMQLPARSGRRAACPPGSTSDAHDSIWRCARRLRGPAGQGGGGRDQSPADRRHPGCRRPHLGGRVAPDRPSSGLAAGRRSCRHDRIAVALVDAGSVARHVGGVAGPVCGHGQCHRAP